MIKLLLRALMLPCLLAFASFLSFAQNEDIDESDVYQLSPFVVDTKSDDGYLARSTLAGTRLRTDLKDVASSISVMTPEFLTDVAAVDVQEAYLYSVNTESTNEFRENDSEGEDVANLTNNRVRGLRSSTNSRDFFESKLRGDSYNTERFTFSNGPNSILFGIGSPAGTINVALKKASLAADFGSITIRNDSNDSFRQSFDLNQVMKNEKVAIRVAGMNQDSRGWRQPESNKERRIYVAMTAEPFKYDWGQTTIRANFEAMENTAHIARQRIATDRVTDWIAAGRPLYDHVNNRVTYDNGNSWTVLDEIDPDFVSTNDRRVHMAGGAIDLPGGFLSGFDLDADVADYYHTLGLNALSWRGTAISYDDSLPDKTFTDESIVPFDLNLNGLAARTELEAEVTGFVIEQNIYRKLFIELAYNKEDWSRDSYDPLRNERLQADVSYYLPLRQLPDFVNTTAQPWLTDNNGDPVLVQNPNAGRYFVQNDGIFVQDAVDTETLRLTASYELDLTERNKWFGRHNIAAMMQTQTIDRHRNKRVHMNNGPFVVGGSNNTNRDNGDNTVVSRYYIDAPGQSTANGISYPGLFEIPDARIWSTSLSANRGAGIHDISTRELTAKLLVYQGRFWDDRVIATLGFRNDEEKIWVAPNERDPISRDWLPGSIDYSSDGKPQDGNTKTQSLVVHLPGRLEGLSLFYNRSDTFEPQGDLHDYFNQPLPPADGEGEDIGFLVNMFDGKISARVGWYKNSANGALELDWTYERIKWRMINFVEGAIEGYVDDVIPARPDWAAERGLSVNDAPVNDRPVIGDSLRSIRDFEATGVEIEIHAKPTENWDIVLTAAKNESVNLRTLPNLQKFVEARRPVWEKYYDLPTPGNIPDITDPSQDIVIDRFDRRAVGYRLFTGASDGGFDRYEFALSENGKATARARKWRVNLVSSYRFTEGRLNGLGLGGSIRWRDKAAIGYEGIPNPFNPDSPLLSPDIDNPVMGEPETYIDAWVNYRRPITIAGKDLNWRVALNIRNLFNDDDLYPTRFTNGAFTEYNVPEPRVFILTNTIEF